MRMNKQPNICVRKHESIFDHYGFTPSISFDWNNHMQIKASTTRNSLIQPLTCTSPQLCLRFKCTSIMTQYISLKWGIFLFHMRMQQTKQCGRQVSEINYPIAVVFSMGFSLPLMTITTARAMSWRVKYMLLSSYSTCFQLHWGYFCMN